MLGASISEILCRCGTVSAVIKLKKLLRLTYPQHWREELATKSIRQVKEGGGKCSLRKSRRSRKAGIWLAFSDAALANKGDGVSSIAAHIVILLGVDMHCCPLSKIKRVVNSPLAAAEASTSWRDWKTAFT